MIYLLFEDILILIFILIFQIEHEMIVSKFFKRQKKILKKMIEGKALETF